MLHLSYPPYAPEKCGLHKFDQNCKNISGTIKHCLDIQVKRKQNKIIFNQRRKQGQSKQTILCCHTKPCTASRNLAFAVTLLADIYASCTRFVAP